MFGCGPAWLAKVLAYNAEQAVPPHTGANCLYDTTMFASPAQCAALRDRTDEHIACCNVHPCSMCCLRCQHAWLRLPFLLAHFLL